MRSSYIKYITLLAISFCFIIVASSCSSGEGREVLSFFFDGVENGVVIEDEDSVLVNQRKNVEQKKSEFFELTNFHEPYKGKQCDMCHESKASNRLIEPQPLLCYNCHDDFAAKYSYLHGPVASGYCTNCHHPHMSKNHKLLKRTGKQICYECHQGTDVLKNDIHSDIDDTDCTECHNPHGGEDKFLM